MKVNVYGGALLGGVVLLGGMLLIDGSAQAVPGSVGIAGPPGAVIAWGDNAAGQTSVPAEALTGVSAIAAGSGHGLAIKKGRVIAWGDNAFGQATVPVEALTGVSAIAAGSSHSLALKAGRVIAWGRGQEGQTTVPADALTGVDAISAGTTFSVALKAGRVIIWGVPTGYQGAPLPIEPPAEASSGVSAIAAGVFAMAIKDGRVIAWGDNTHGEVSVPTDAQSGVTAIAAGGDVAVAIKAGRVIAWGGFPGSGITAVPTDAQAGVSQVSASAALVLALRDGRVIAWGADADRSGAREVPEWLQRGTTAVAAGGYFGLGISQTVPPGQPRQVQTSMPSPGVIRVTWKAPKPNGSAKVTGYLVSYRPFLQVEQPWQSMTVPKLTATIAGLPPGQLYDVRVSARTAQGIAVPSATVLGLT